jgi:hypothetical protein
VRPGKLKRPLEIEALRLLATGQSNESVSESLKVDLQAVRQLSRDIAAKAKKAIETDRNECVEAVQSAVRNWQEVPTDSMESKMVQCRYCKTESSLSKKWHPAKHLHKSDCIVVRAKRIVALIRESIR